MAEITAAKIKELRESTGAGMMDCKKALVEAGGNMDAAVDWLRTKGLAAAAKKAGRVAAEGLVAVATSGTKGAMIELNSETDFVARNDQFQALAETFVNTAIEAGCECADTLKTKENNGSTVEALVTEGISKIGENLNLRRVAYLEENDGIVVPYIHTAVKPGLGKIGVLVALKSTGDKTALEAFGKQVAMHVAAARPEALTREEVSADLIEREREVLKEQAIASGKPVEIAEKMVEGRIRKFYEEIVLPEQVFVIDGKATVTEAMKEAEKEVGAPIELTGFRRFALGEGVEKAEEDFADEVAKVANA
ncbi:MAG: translation elongation factor Ts [Rickettsiales bacterium]|nr:translation elongation factor Ts [Rickettsiales bacterium]